MVSILGLHVAVSEYMIRILLVIVALMPPYFCFAAQKCPPVSKIDSRDIVGIQNYLSINNFGSIDCFLSALPKDIRAFRTYFKDSLSMQAASVTHPRALVGAPDGGFFLTFNGHPSQQGYNEIEVIALDKNVNPTKWVTAVIRQENGELHFQKNVKKCSACHGNPIKPIWGVYPSWPNAFGSIDDWLPDPANLGKKSKFYEEDIVGNDYGDSGNSEPRLSQDEIELAIRESNQFRAFREKAKLHPRYSALERASDNNSPVYPYTEIYRNRNNAFRPNLTIGSVMTVRQSEILVNRLKKNPVYLSYKNSLFHYYKCSKTGSSDDHNKMIHSFLNEAYHVKYGREMPANPFGKSPNYSDHFFDLFGASPHEKTLLFASDTDYLSKYNRTYFSGYFTIITNVMDELLEGHIRSWHDKENFLYENISPYDPYDQLEALLEKYPHTSYFQSEFLGRDFYLQLTQSRGGYSLTGVTFAQASGEQKQTYAKMCLKLKNLSKNEMSNKIDHKLFTHIPATPAPWPKALNTCIECHDNGSNSVAMRIPFRNPEKLASYNLTFQSGYGWGNLFTSIDLLTLETMAPAHLNGTRMPLGHRPLSEQERKDLSNWVEKGL